MLNLLINRQHIVMMADNSERIMLGLQKIEKLYPFSLTTTLFTNLL
jgi:hypothetical protein